MLDESARELEETIEREESLRKRLEAKEAERLDVEEKYSSLQEEAAGKTRKLKKVWGVYQGAKAELGDLQSEQQREMEGLLDNVRSMTRELRLQMLAIDSFVPTEYQVRGSVNSVLSLKESLIYELFFMMFVHHWSANQLNKYRKIAKIRDSCYLWFSQWPWRI